MTLHKDFAKNLAQHVDAKKTLVFKDLKGYQLPVQAHTSQNAKLAIGFSVVTSVVALTAVTALLAHKVLYRKLPEYRTAFDVKATETEKWVEEQKAEAEKAAATVKKKASKVVDEVAEKVKKTTKKNS